MVGIADVLADLRAESEDLDALVADLPESGWAIDTPAPGWTIAHQIAHLNWTDHAALAAATDPDTFAEIRRAAAVDLTLVIEGGAADGASLPAADLLAHWRRGRAALATALAAAGPVRLPWIGTTMSPTSMATARIMETWAHGQDVADALGVDRVPTGRLRHVAHLGVITRDHAFGVHGRTPPAEPFRVELTAPNGSIWTWGPDDRAPDVTGPALDFCLLVTRRRHRADLSLTATTEDADQWLGLAQAFAGPPGPDRPPAG
ncbi:TIGR03084 family metal-binding protein [Nakamurella sp.]|uniref:TIGR03084 family metal-binding protein n=1 Tax=Nakamurella sp. TaxID=1869182 RepID=UPI0037842327